MNYTLYGFSLAGSLFFGMLILIEVGRRIGVRRRAKDPEAGRAGFGTIEAAVLALLGAAPRLHRLRSRREIRRAAAFDYRGD